VTARRRTAVLISGRGSNLAALIAASKQPDYPAEIVLVLSNRPEATGLAHSEASGIRTAIVDHKACADRPAFEKALDAALRSVDTEIACLAGFMRLLTPDFVAAWRDRLINIHPSLLPAFPGLHTHEQALTAGVKIHGATVHFVRAETDSGPIIAQGAVPVLAEDDAVALAERVLKVEHRIYPLALKLVASGAARVVGERVIIDGAPVDAGTTLLSPPA
jgi:phosphoribosylglycinamide formyltransferase-1